MVLPEGVKSLKKVYLWLIRPGGQYEWAVFPAVPYYPLLTDMFTRSDTTHERDRHRRRDTARWHTPHYA